MKIILFASVLKYPKCSDTQKSNTQNVQLNTQNVPIEQVELPKMFDLNTQDVPIVHH